MSKMLRRWGLLLLLWVPMAQGEPHTIQIIELQHRPAAELLPRIQPLLDTDDAASGAGFQLILQGPRARLDPLREVVRSLDTAPLNLRIQVHRGPLANRTERHFEDAGAGFEPFLRGHRTEGHRGTQAIRVLEGRHAFIHSGESIPQAHQRVLVGPGAIVISSEVRYRDLGDGLLVRPWITPDGRVRLEIQQVHQREDRSRGGVIDWQHVDTVITGRPGDWIQIAGSDRAQMAFDRGVRSTRGLQEHRDVAIHVRVDPVE